MKGKDSAFNIRYGSVDDLEDIASVEAECFPPTEAADKESFRERLQTYGNHFWLMYDGNRLIAFVDGFVTDLPDLTDEMFADASMHNEHGKWQMIFGVNTLPEYRHQGLATRLLRQVIEDAREQGRAGLVLTCKEALIPLYSKVGFISEGVTEKSSHGGAVWYQMRLTFE